MKRRVHHEAMRVCDHEHDNLALKLTKKWAHFLGLKTVPQHGIAACFCLLPPTKYENGAVLRPKK